MNIRVTGSLDSSNSLAVPMLNVDKVNMEDITGTTREGEEQSGVQTPLKHLLIVHRTAGYGVGRNGARDGFRGKISEPPADTFWYARHAVCWHMCRVRVAFFGGSRARLFSLCCQIHMMNTAC